MPPGPTPGEPAKYYPTGKRNYVRIVPKDTIQGAALVSMMKQDGCTKTSSCSTTRRSSAPGWRRNIVNAAKTQGLDVVANEAIDKNAAELPLAGVEGASAEGADCMVYAGITANNAVQIFKDFAAALPNGQALRPRRHRRVRVRRPRARAASRPRSARRSGSSIAVLPPEKYGADGQKFFADYKAEYGDDSPDPYAIYGYEAMSLTLDAIERAAAKGKVDRAAVIEQLFATKDRDSVLGTYSIDANGDTTLTDYGAYRIEDGALVFDRHDEAAS